VKIEKLKVGRGRTSRLSDVEEWTKEYYEIDVVIENPAELEVAKANLTGLIDGWLSASKPAAKLPTPLPKLEAQAKGVEEWDPCKIRWEEAQGSSGLYERSEDVNNPEFKSMLKDLAAHGGRLSREGFFYWVFKNGTTVGRKGRNREKASETKPEKVSALFPEDLRSLLSFEQKADAVIMKPRQFLGSENFAKIADIVKQQGGEYVSAGKNSHFRIPIKSS